MAADQRRKLLNGASTAACASSEQYKIKKKKLKSLQNDLIAKSHISLEWDGNHKKVVAKKEQVGISWRHLRPFLVSSPRYHNVLADVFTLPREIFELDDLTQVISYEAWKTHLSENERNLLMQFLPKGTDREMILQTLLAGENFHFGNPFLQWSASLCSGHLHPDAVISHEQCLKADKKAYYSELQKYHDEIIGHLQKLKENWKSYEDPETEIAQNIWRSRRDPEKRTLSCVNESRLADTEQDASATSESCSWNADEKACTSDNQNSSVVKGVEFQKRIYKKGIIKDKHRTPLITSDDVLNKEAKPRRGDKLQKRNIQQSDGVKYMSYIKISKKQHELVKSMKQSGKSIQSRSLNRVLGNLNSFHVQPYEVFMEEEKIKLHEHWLKLARQDLPVAYGNWRDVRLLKREIIKSLNLDLHDNLSAVLQDGKKSAKISQHQEENGVNSKVLDEEKENSNCVFQDQKDNEPTESESYMQDSGESRPGSSRNQSCQQLSINSSYLCSHMDLDSVKSHHISKLDAASSDASEYSGNLKAADVPVNQGVHLSSAEDVWPGHGALHSYQDSTAGREYSAVSGLSLTHQQTNENQRSQLINLDSSLAEEDTRKVLLHGQSDGGSFSSFPNQHRHELLQSLLKDERMLSYNHEQKPTGLDFQSPKNVFTGNGRFPGHFQEQLQPSPALEQGQKRQNEIYMQQHISPNIYSDGGRYVIPRQELLPSGNMADWTVNPVRMPAPYQQQLNSGDLFSQNWFPSEHQVQVRNGWSGSDGVSVSNQGIGSAASNSNADQSLFSVLSQCNQLRSGNPYGSMHTTEQFISAMPRNYGMVGSGNSAMSNNLAQASHPLDYLGGRDAATSLMADDMGWMNLTHQNPGLHDPMGKPYLRSWNQ